MIIDRRRVSRDRSTENRARFIKRNKESIKRNLNDILNNRSLGDSASQGGTVVVKNKSTKEPVFHYGQGGTRDIVAPGNDKYTEGDPLPKPPGSRGGGGGKNASDAENSEDDFFIDLSKEEFQDLIFEDCELPNLVKTELFKSKEVVRFTAGFQPNGSPSRLSIVRSYKESLVRRIAQRGVIDAELDKLALQFVDKHEPVECYTEFELATAHIAIQTASQDTRAYTLSEQLNLIARYQELLKKRQSLVLFEDDDLRYRSVKTLAKPARHATMVMIMDNSGSMGEREKTIARKFFLILYLFLTRQYDAVELVFISHTTSAREMTEHEFFNTRENGGTIVSSALEVLIDVIKRLEGKTNVYVAQVSDGDNMDVDNGTCTELLEDSILEHVRYFAYVQVDEDKASSQSQALLNFGKGLWKSYETVADAYKHFCIKRVTNDKDIIGVFRELFAKQ